MQLILVKIKWHIKWKYLIKKFHDICLSYYFKYQEVGVGMSLSGTIEKLTKRISIVNINKNIFYIPVLHSLCCHWKQLSQSKARCFGRTFYSHTIQGNNIVDSFGNSRTITKMCLLILGSTVSSKELVLFE